MQSPTPHKKQNKHIIAAMKLGTFAPTIPSYNPVVKGGNIYPVKLEERSLATVLAKDIYMLMF